MKCPREVNPEGQTADGWLSGTGETRGKEVKLCSGFEVLF